MLTKTFAKNVTQILKPDFSTIDQVRNLMDEYCSKKLIIKNQDEDQLWTQLQMTINDTIKNCAKQLKYIEDRSSKIADQIVENENQDNSDQQQEEEQNHQNQELNDELDQELEQEDIEEEIDQEEQEQEEDQEDQEEEDRIPIKKNSNKFAKNEDDSAEFDKYMQDLDDGKIDVEQDDEDDDEEDQDEEQPQQDSEHGEDSVFDEMREEDLQNQDEEIEQLESKVLKQKDWQFQGEVSSRQRPLNSLVEQDLDFQVNRQRIEEALPEQTKKLDDYIRQRIKDELFDDRQKVQLSLQPVHEKFQVDTNKSQVGLSEIYERQFKQALGLPTNTTEQKMKQEVFGLFRDLCYQLDSLSNLSFEPRGYIKSAEVKVDVISKEEKVPLTLRGEVQLGQKVGGVLESKEEATTQDNQRKHRQVKQRLRNKLREQKRSKLMRNLDSKGETKFMYNEHKKGQKKLEGLNSQIKNRESVTFDKSSRFFKNLESHKIQKKK